MAARALLAPTDRPHRPRSISRSTDAVTSAPTPSGAEERASGNETRRRRGAAPAWAPGGPPPPSRAGAPGPRARRRGARGAPPERSGGAPRREPLLVQLGHGQRRQRPVAWKVGPEQPRAWP